MEGFLFKKGRGESTFGRRNWKRRWFILEGSYLTYYEDFDREAGKPVNKKGVVPVHACDIREGPHLERKNAFIIKHAERKPFFLCADTEQIMKLWISALTVAARGKSMGKNIDFSEYYELLGLDKTRSYTSSELNRAFRKKALAAHPDKGGDIETFKSVQDAYNILVSKLEEEEEAKKFIDVYFTAQIQKGPPGVGFGILVQEDANKGDLRIKELKATAQIMHIDNPDIKELLPGDQFVNIGDDDVTSWPLSRLTQRLNDFRVPAGEQVAVRFCRRVLNPIYSSCQENNDDNNKSEKKNENFQENAAANDADDSWKDQDSNVNDKFNAKTSFQSNFEVDGNSRVYFESLKAENEEYKIEIDKVSEVLHKLRREKDGLAESIEDILDDRDELKKELLLYKKALRESRLRESYLELVIQQSIMFNRVNEEQMIQSMKDMVQISNDISFNKSLVSNSEVLDYLEVSGIASLEDSHLRISVEKAVQAVYALDKTGNILNKWNLMGDHCLSKIQRLQSNLQQLHHG